MNWHYVDANGEQAGPVDDAGLDALIAAGTVRADTLVWREGMANWQPCGELKTMPAAPAASGIEEAVCAECGGIFPVNETIRVGSSRVCANCKPKFVQKMREGVSVEQAGAFRYAGFWIRFAAVFVDGILLLMVDSALRKSFGLPLVAGFGGPANQGAPMVILIVGLIQMAIAIAYETVMIGKYGATLGKMACKIHVVVADGTRVSYLRAFARYFAKLVSWIICLIGFIMAGFDSEKRALHDRMCNTRVVFNQ